METINLPFDDFDLVIDSFQLACMNRIVTVIQDTIPVTAPSKPSGHRRIPAAGEYGLVERGNSMIYSVRTSSASFGCGFRDGVSLLSIGDTGCPLSFSSIYFDLSFN